MQRDCRASGGLHGRVQKSCLLYTSMFFFALDVHKINKKAIESLIKAGALDCFDPNRAAHIGIYESLIESAQSSAKKNIEGQLSLFQLAADTMEESNVCLLYTSRCV